MVVRQNGTTFPAGVDVIVADLGSVESLAEAFRGQDAVIDATATPDSSVNRRIVDAAVAARVYRLIPAEFSADPKNAKVRSLPVFHGITQTFSHVEDLAAQSPIMFTSISNGGFLDWILETVFLDIDIFGKNAKLMNSGELVIPWTCLSTVGNAVVQALLRTEEIENRCCYIYSVCKSQKEILYLAMETLDSDG